MMRHERAQCLGKWNEWDGERDIEDGGLCVWRKQDVRDVAKGKAEPPRMDSVKVKRLMRLVKRWSLATKKALGKVSARELGKRKYGEAMVRT
ncbi:hypothetical protein AX14_010928 [Amanita brunnescens Koide BX004]|nr:hypothetical protein AX14_010928 [Amanita brunnescens Koide BX004]